MGTFRFSIIKRSTAVMLVTSFAAAAQAVPINWTDWTSSNPTNGFTSLGTITTPTATVSVTYNNPQGISFIQTNGGTDYWQNNRAGRDPATSPYTSAQVDNIPTGTDIVALNRAGTQTLQFSETIANPIFAYVSLNGNGYAFDQDFEILSFGDASDGNDCGYWGCGTSFKQIVDIGGGVLEYQLLGTGEPHGTLRFTGAFDTVTWRSLSNENWNGFTVGIEGTAQEVLLGDITGVKWEDLNGNGIFDTTESGLAGWVMELFDDAGASMGTAITDADGKYMFKDLMIGNYSVAEFLQTGWVQTFNGGAALTVVGGGTVMADFGNQLIGTSPPPGVSVPNPATLVLFGLGFAGLGYQRRKRQ